MEAAAEIGSTANNYQVLAKLATGGMAEIFLARSAGVASVQRYVVLKRVLRERASDMSFIRMFLDEARLAAQLQHANVAQVYDVGKLGDSYFFTMEYVHGETVRAVLSRAHELRRSPPLGCVLAIAAGTAAGLHHAHTRIGIEGRPLGIVHRDVSPSNLMVGYDGGVKVVDFGVAKAADRVHETRSGAVKGKISYLSPEQARGQKLDQRSDLFSLGIVMWELLTVERLYKLDSDFATMTAIIHEPPPPPSSRRRDIPPEVDGLVLRALAKDPADRFQTAEEMAEAIERVAIQNNAALSPASLSRFVRELFGSRPEPWHALQSPRDTGAPSIVTVTSEPLPAELAIPISDPIDRRLANLVDLSTFESTSETSPMPIRVPDRAASGLPVAPRPAPLPVTRSLSAVSTPLGGAERRPEHLDVSAVHASGTPASAAAIPASGPRPAPPVVAALDATAQHSETALVARGRSRWWLPLLAGVTGIVVAIAIALVVGRGGRSLPDAAPVASAPRDAEALVQPVVDDAPVHVVLTDASPAAAPADPTSGRPAAPTSGPGSATGSGSGSAAGSGSATPAAAAQAILTACLAGTNTSYDQCAIAACVLGNVANARRWFKKVSPARQGVVVQVCTRAAVAVAPPPPPPVRTGSATAPRGSAPPPPPPPPKPDCEKDPFACPR